MLQDVEQKTAEDPHPRSPRRTNRWLFSMSVGVGRGWLKELCITTLTKTNERLFVFYVGRRGSCVGEKKVNNHAHQDELLFVFYVGRRVPVGG